MIPSVLLVDDEPAVQLGVSKYLGKRGYAISTASRLSEAREALSQERCDVVLLDLRLPDGNGLDWIRDLKGEYPGMTVVVITAVDEIPVAVEAMRRGADDFLPKPVTPRELDVFLRKYVFLGKSTDAHKRHGRRGLRSGLRTRTPTADDDHDQDYGEQRQRPTTITMRITNKTVHRQRIVDLAQPSAWARRPVGRVTYGDSLDLLLLVLLIVLLASSESRFPPFTGGTAQDRLISPRRRP